MSWKNPLFLITAALAIMIIPAVREVSMLPDGRLHIAFLDVGQGDSALIVTPSGKRIIIDGGPAEGSMLAELSRRMPLFDRTIDLLILSHPQLDHLFAFPDLLRRYRVKRVLMTGVQYDLPRYREFLQLIREQRIPVWIADPQKDIDFGDGVTLDIIWPPSTLFGQQMKDVNNSSIMLRVLLGTGAIALFTGDAEGEEERAALASGADLSAGILKVGHHGSKTSSGTGFLLAVHPDLAAISSGEKSRYGHPHAIILNRFTTLGIPVRVTAWEGTINMEF